jgi:predicted transcriptional regulator
MGQIRAALAEAERGEFASDEEVRRYVSKWGLDEG